MIKENVSRRIDSLGRLTLPRAIRSRFGWEEGDEIEFYTKGQDFVCLAKKGKGKKLEEVVAELGYTVEEAIEILTKTDI